MERKQKHEITDDRQKQGNPADETVIYKIGGTFYEVSTSCGGSEPLFEKMKPFAETESATLEEAMVKQGNLVQPSNRPENRCNFYKEIDEPDFISNLKVGLQLKARIKAILPSKLIQKIKSL